MKIWKAYFYLALLELNMAMEPKQITLEEETPWSVHIQKWSEIIIMLKLLSVIK